MADSPMLNTSSTPLTDLLLALHGRIQLHEDVVKGISSGNPDLAHLDIKPPKERLELLQAVSNAACSYLPNYIRAPSGDIFRTIHYGEESPEVQNLMREAEVSGDLNPLMRQFWKDFPKLMKWAAIPNPLADATTSPKPEEAVGKVETTKNTEGKKPKRSTGRGEGQVKLIGALTTHHRYSNGSCQNTAPIGNNELARLAGTADSTATEFFKKEFDGYSEYRRACADVTTLIGCLKAMNNEFTPRTFLQRKNPEDADAVEVGD